VPESDTSLSPPISNSSAEHKIQPSANESEEHLEENRSQTVIRSVAELDSVRDTACRHIRSRTLLA